MRHPEAHGYDGPDQDVFTSSIAATTPSHKWTVSLLGVTEAASCRQRACDGGLRLRVLRGNLHSASTCAEVLKASSAAEMALVVSASCAAPVR